jgi:hypothetical protein
VFCFVVNPNALGPQRFEASEQGCGCCHIDIKATHKVWQVMVGSHDIQDGHLAVAGLVAIQAEGDQIAGASVALCELMRWRQGADAGLFVLEA